MKAVQDFNYKVALASGLKSLQAGRLRQAEEQFRYLVSKFPRADGGYRGLAKVFVQLDDRPGAVAALRDGAAALAKGGDRSLAIGLLQEAIALDPLDLAAHRRLAAAYALAGDVPAAASEYSRFSRAQQDAGDAERARIEAGYALETLGEIPALAELARALDMPLRTVRAAVPATAAPAAAAPPDGEVAAGFRDLATPPGDLGWPPVEKAEAAPAEAAEVVAPAPPPPSPAPVPAAVAPASPAPTVDPFELERRAAEMLASRDAGAGDAALGAARELAAAGRTLAASDLLLQLIAAGIAHHQAQRQLAEVAASLGKREVARAKCDLLAQALVLHGEREQAMEIERLGRTF